MRCFRRGAEIPLMKHCLFLSLSGCFIDGSVLLVIMCILICKWKVWLIFSYI